MMFSGEPGTRAACIGRRPPAHVLCTITHVCKWTTAAEAGREAPAAAGLADGRPAREWRGRRPCCLRYRCIATQAERDALRKGPVLFAPAAARLKNRQRHHDSTLPAGGTAHWYCTQQALQ